MSWDRRSKLFLAVGAACWAAAVALTPGELAAAKRRDPVRARTAIVVLLYVAATIGVLRGLPRGNPPDLPSR
ncbi:MAG: hypothetical protein HYV09_16115 [Deltaproteobacteria bacterium]|nr:hypothetical protein [Deltaproteobacteria bacterium]